MKNYKECLNYLYEQLPMFQRKGAAAYKANLENTLALDELFNHPHHAFKTIHVGGTNGKGSSSHMLASILQEAGYRVGLYTSPHLVDFRERIRINGEMISEDAVLRFMKEYLALNEEAKIEPSFFELTVLMAFQYFKEQAVDVAVIEVGLGGRLDSTNIIMPEVSLITNISFDHTNLLGGTIEAIAREKAGIIKRGVPVVISESNEVYNFVFEEKAAEMVAPIFFADRCEFAIKDYELPLKGIYQQRNICGVLQVIAILQNGEWKINSEQIADGLAHVLQNTKLRGRWEVVHQQPMVVCDTGHNEAGIQLVVEQLAQTPKAQLWIVFGMVGDKDQRKVLSLLPKDANYIFTQPSIERAMSASDLASLALEFGLKGEVLVRVKEAVDYALSKASPADVIYVGGSTFVVADYFS
ncbi:MAG: bifunctional folylpolyglutamate synthase/dihydrofolate synthase [Mangrovibacterium sp.]